jgi:uncharacterized transporter YbjL
MVLIELVVMIQMTIVASRARRGGVVGRTANMMNIQGGMTVRLVGLRSRQERHEEKRKERNGKEREGQKARGRKRRTAAAGPLSPFSRLVE